MAFVNPIDPTPERVSACPVHFLWDGRGPGRPLVRAGFLGFVLAGILASAGSLWLHRAAHHVALLVAGAAAVAWLGGQALSAWSTRRRRDRSAGA